MQEVDAINYLKEGLVIKDHEVDVINNLKEGFVTEELRVDDAINYLKEGFVIEEPGLRSRLLAGIVNFLALIFIMASPTIFEL